MAPLKRLLGIVLLPVWFAVVMVMVAMMPPVWLLSIRGLDALGTAFNWWVDDLYVAVLRPLLTA